MTDAELIEKHGTQWGREITRRELERAKEGARDGH